MALSGNRIEAFQCLSRSLVSLAFVVLVSVALQAQSELDVLVVYTQAVEDYYGDEDGVLAHVQSGIVSANTGLTNSENSVQLVLRDLQKISYVEGSSLPDDLVHITSSSEVSALRDQVGADLVCLFRNGNAGGLSGYAWILGSESGDPGGAFSVVGSQSAVSTLTFQHEIGHNLGAAHDRDNASTGGLYSYSYGHRFVGTDTTQYRTIMAYSPGQNINYFSNPNVDYQGTPTGIATGPDSADNARTFEMISAIVEAYRDRIGEGENSSPTLVLPIPDQTAIVDENFDLDVSPNFNDVDLEDTLSFSATLVGGAPLPGWLSLDGVTGAFSGTPSSSDLGTLMIEVTASDGEASVSDSFDLFVEEPNGPPVLVTPIDDQTAITDTLFTLDASGNFDDPDEDPLQFGAALDDEQPLPDWLTIDFETGVFSGTPESEDVGELTILVGAFDGEDVATDLFVLTVQSPNQSPTIVQAVQDQVTSEDELFSLDLSANFADPDPGDTLFFSATLEGGGSLPSWLGLDGAVGLLSGNPGNADVGTINIEITASDGELSVSDVFEVVVENVDDPPEVSASIPDQVVNEDALFSLDVSANFDDPDTGDVLSFAATLEGGGPLPFWLGFDSSTGQFSGTPLNEDVGTIAVEVSVSDGEFSVADLLEITVENSNDPPFIASPISDRSVNEDAPFSQVVALHFDDPDVGDVLFFSANLVGGSELPAWLALDGESGEFSGIPKNEDVGSLLIELTGTDGEEFVTSEFNLVVENVNDVPQLVLPVSDQSTNEDELFSIDLSPNFSDVDVGDVLTFSAALENGDPLPQWLTLVDSNGVLSGTPTNDHVGNLNIVVTASDGTVSASDGFFLTVENVNDRPTLLSPIADQHVLVGNALSSDLSIHFADIDEGDALTYIANLVGGGALPGWLQLDPNTGLLSGTPESSNEDLLEVRLTVSDGQLSLKEDFSIQVKQSNYPPVLVEPIADQTATVDNLFDLNVSNSFHDVDEGQDLTFTASLVGGESLPGWLSIDAQTGLFSGTPASNDVGAIWIQASASDGEESVSDEFQIQVIVRNGAPSVTSDLVDQWVREGEIFRYSVSEYFEDPDEEDTLTFEASLENGEPLPNWLKFDKSTALFRGVPWIEGIGAWEVEVTASDGVDSVKDSYLLQIVSDVRIVKIGNQLFLEVSDYNSQQRYALWESLDLVNWQLLEAQPTVVEGKLRFEIPIGSSSLYRVAVSG